MSRQELFLGLCAIAAGLAYVGVGTRASWGRSTARTRYLNQRLPFVFRVEGALAPLMAVGFSLEALMVLVPRHIGVWIAFAGLLCVEAAALLSFRSPIPFTPRWLQEEIDRGITPKAKPDMSDWAFFWVFAIGSIVGDIAFVVLVLAFHAVLGD